MRNSHCHCRITSFCCGQEHAPLFVGFSTFFLVMGSINPSFLNLDFIIHRVYSRDELLPLLQKCVDVLENALDRTETKR